jgi:hypothetical protein
MQEGKKGYLQTLCIVRYLLLFGGVEIQGFDTPCFSISDNGASP